MKVKSVIVQNGIIIGASLEVNDAVKNARLTDLRKLCTLNKITSGCKLIDNQLYFEPDVLNNIFPQETYKFDHYDYDEDGKAKQAVLSNGQTLDFNSLWKLAADNRVEGIVAGYNNITESKVLQTLS